jgi:flagellar M-ring protein FliF
MVLLGVVVLLFVVRPLTRRIFAPQLGGDGAPRALIGPGGVAIGPGGVTLGPTGSVTVGGGVNISAAPGGSITSAGGPNVSIVGSDESVAISNRTSAMIDIAQVQGQVHAQSVQKVGELADKNPNETVSIIRSWLHEHAA